MKDHAFEKHEVETYERKRYRGWDQRLVDAREQKILKKIFRKIGKDLKKVLDLPSGYGRFSDLVLGQGMSLVSCDLSFHMARRARERGSKSGWHQAVAADAKRGLPFKDAAFDGLLSLRFFHHVQEPEGREAILREYARVSSGWLILSFYQKNFLHSLQRRMRKKIKKTRTKIKMLERKILEREVEKAGFQKQASFPLFRGLHAQQILLLKKKIGSGEGLLCPLQ